MIQNLSVICLTKYQVVPMKNVHNELWGLSWLALILFDRRISLSCTEVAAEVLYATNSALVLEQILGKTLITLVSSNKLGFPPVSTGTVVIMNASSMEGIAQYTQHSVHTSGQGKPAIFGSRWEPGSKQIHFIWNVLNGSKCWCANQNRTSFMLLYKLP